MQITEEKEAKKELKKRSGSASKRLKDWRDCRSVGRNPLVKGNRLQPGMQRRRWDCNPHDGLTITKKYEELMKKGAPDQRDVLLVLQRSWDRRPDVLKRIVKTGTDFWIRKAKLEMKAGAGTRASLNKRGQWLSHQERLDGDSRGARAPGGGAPNRFAAHIAALQNWIDVELTSQVAVAP